MSDRRRDPRIEVVRHGPFAVVYWAVAVAGLVVTIAVLLLGTTEQRIIMGYVAFGILVALTVAQYLMARRLRHREERA